MGNTHKGIKDCQLCGATNMNHESHIIIKCKNLKEVREATDVAEFCQKNANLDNDSGHITLRTYLDPETPKMLIDRAHAIQYIMKSWEKMTQEKTGSVAKTYCYCKQGAFGRMVQCDGCMDWFHLVCAELDENFMSLDDWFCKHCQNIPMILIDCCNSQHDESRETIRCRGACKRQYHPDCLELDTSKINANWICQNC